AGVAGCFAWRIGFTGELSYEIHVPAAYGLHVWESLLAAGSDLGAAAFGVEAQRIMRLEKGHFIVGQDTDGLTQAHAAGLDRLEHGTPTRLPVMAHHAHFDTEGTRLRG